jgi:AcrR family transcriptional regulator
MEEELTARARIRRAALEQFADLGFERTTIRGIAASAGVSPGLLRHHFGSKQALRDAVDAHVLQEIRRLNDLVKEGSESGDFGAYMGSRAALQPFQGYLSRALLDGSPLIAAMFDQIVTLTEDWLAQAEHDSSDPYFADRRDRAAVFTAMVFGVPLLREHLSRALGVDTLSPGGEQRLTLALLDIYSHALISPELAALARKGLETTPTHGSTP